MLNCRQIPMIKLDCWANITCNFFFFFFLEDFELTLMLFSLIMKHQSLKFKIKFFNQKKNVKITKKYSWKIVFNSFDLIKAHWLYLRKLFLHQQYGFDLTPKSYPFLKFILCIWNIAGKEYILKIDRKWFVVWAVEGMKFFDI